MQPAACRIAYRQPNHCDTNTSDFHRILTTNDTALTTALLYSRSMSSSKKAVPQIRRGVDASRQRRVIGLGGDTGLDAGRQTAPSARSQGRRRSGLMTIDDTHAIRCRVRGRRSKWTAGVGRPCLTEASLSR